MNYARDFAIKAHGDQKHSGRPYVFHLDEVAGVLMEFGNFDKPLLDAAFLHDVLEDTHISATDLEIFDVEARRLVLLVTDKPGQSRAERQMLTYPGIAENPKAITLKLADRIANVRASAPGGKYITLYRGEQAFFRHVLKREHHGAMWAELDRLLC